jgi:hypothetical protein
VTLRIFAGLPGFFGVFWSLIESSEVFICGDSEVELGWKTISLSIRVFWSLLESSFVVTPKYKYDVVD